jgi:predicted dehydrogenase
MSAAAQERIRFGVIGLNHGHIYGQVRAVQRGGGRLVSFYAQEEELVKNFAEAFPEARQARAAEEILDDDSLQLVVSAAIPNERAALGIKVMNRGKDYMVDKPGITSLAQLAEVRSAQCATSSIYSIMYSERFESPATVRALELVSAGAVGQVLQTIGLGPHRLNAPDRPPWFFDRACYGGILCDIGSHQCDQFLCFTGSTAAEITAAHAGNLHHPEYPGLDDFGEMLLNGSGGQGYVRVDWFTPPGLPVWGDTRLTILGTDGYIELRKNIDLAGRPGAEHLFLVGREGVHYFDCSETPLPYGEQLVTDILERTESSMTQAHCFLATELALRAQAVARPPGMSKETATTTRKCD